MNVSSSRGSIRVHSVQLAPLGSYEFGLKGSIFTNVVPILLALGLGAEYYRQLSAEYVKRRDHIVSSFKTAGLDCFVPKGAYYVMTGISALTRSMPCRVTFNRSVWY